MNGQWLGRYTGTNAGTFVFDVDDLGSHFEGWAYLYDDVSTLPALMAFVRTKDRSQKFTLDDVPLYPLHPPLAEPRQWAEISSNYPLLSTIATKANVEVNWSATDLHAKAHTDIGTSIEAHAPRTAADQPSVFQPATSVASWASFKTYALNLETDRYIFRGQRKPWRLRTRYHRTRRADLRRYHDLDIMMLSRAILPKARHTFNFDVPDQFGAFLNLAQHHGYPTPMLDWTYSPFVAAFFAYWKVLNVDATTEANPGHVRIFVFDRKGWHEKFRHVPFLRPAGLNLTVMDFMALENERAVPQQSVSTVTNIDDVESYIKGAGGSGREYLTVIDLPISERPAVIRELRMMGITAGTLFPGLDGVCEDLRERNF